jgi:hypothetical protein
MTGLISTILNYYGFLHLCYYSSQQFLTKRPIDSKKASTNKDTAGESGEGTEEEGDKLYVWLSKW